MNVPDREYYDIGDSPKGRPFQPGKDACQRLWHALVICDGKVHDIYDGDAEIGVGIRDRYSKKEMKIGSTIPQIRLSIRAGLKELFETTSGFELIPPPKVQLSRGLND